MRREPKIDFQSANFANLSGINDADVLFLASQEGRVLVSHDQRTMPHHFAEFITRQQSTGVIIVLQSLSIRDVINQLIAIWKLSETEDWVNRIAYLPLC